MRQASSQLAQYPKQRGTSTNAGFTIIETLIVLGVAGLMLLIVFEAIPTLQRNGRNNQRKQDVATILQAVSHYELNNSADMPQPSGNFLQYARLSYYNKSAVQYGSTPANGGIGMYGYTDAISSPPTAGPLSSTEVVEIHNYQKCSATVQGGSTRIAAGYTDIVALYAVEAGNHTVVAQCQEL